MHTVTQLELAGATAILDALLPHGAGLSVQGGVGCRITSADGSEEYTPRGTKRETYNLAWAMIKAIQMVIVDSEITAVPFKSDADKAAWATIKAVQMAKL